MYENSPSSILIVKTSSLGDIIQSFSVLEMLRHHLGPIAMDWAVERPFSSIVAAHPFIRRAIPLDIKKNRNLKKSIKELRKEKYDLLFDLQGNCKSAVITWLARAKVKVGYGRKSVREWPNILATHIRFNVSKRLNISEFYLKLVEKYFQLSIPHLLKGVSFQIGSEEKEKIAQIVSHSATREKIMVCPGSRWENKRLKEETLLAFLKKIEEQYGSFFFFVWGDLEEKALCERLSLQLKENMIVEKLSLPAWQNLMNEMDLVIAVDSSALHFCATTTTPSFSIFGPTALSVFKPVGEKHCAIQGTCPFGRSFDKQCPILRSCETGGCIKNLSTQQLFQAFQNQRDFLQR